MAHGKITASLLRCADGREVDVQKFLSEHNDSQGLRDDLHKLQVMGYIAVDYGDNRIDSITLSDKLSDLV